jgi:hypothetical protein
MQPHNPSKQDVIALMRRLGRTDRIAEAQEILPDPVDLQRDSHLLMRLGLNLDHAVNELGGSPY